MRDFVVFNERMSVDAFMTFASACHHELTAFAGSRHGVPLSLFLAGLAGSATHCAGMCGPFVIAQVASDAGTARRYGEWQRLGGAALLPYHFGRLTTYAGFGAIAGATTSLLSPSPVFTWVSSVLLVAAAVIVAAQAFGLALARSSAWSEPMARFAAPLARVQAPWARYALGIALGFLPCGLIYGALAAAGSTGSWLTGTIAMAAFGLGTMPALVAVGWGGALLRRRLGDVAKWLAAPLLLTNALLMLALAGAHLA